MWQFFVFLLILGLIGNVLKWIGAALYVIFFFVILPIIGITITFHIIRAIYHLFNPDAKKAFLDKKEKEEAENRKREEQKEERMNWNVNHVEIAINNLNRINTKLANMEMNHLL